MGSDSVAGPPTAGPERAGRPVSLPRGAQSDGVPVPVLAAVIFDVDGTLADTERYGHRPAFNAAFAVHGVDITWGVYEYGRLLKIAGGKRRIAADLRARGFGDAAEELAVEIHHTKTELFRDRIVAGDLLPRPGLLRLVRSLVDQGIRVAVATTGRRAWVEPLLIQILGDGLVENVVTGDDVRRLKPDPEPARARPTWRIAGTRTGRGGLGTGLARRGSSGPGHGGSHHRLHGGPGLRRSGHGALVVRRHRPAAGSQLSTRPSGMVDRRAAVANR